MESNNNAQAAREFAREQAYRQEMVDAILRAHPEDGSIETLPGLTLNRLSSPREPLHSVTRPSFCVIAQGSKIVMLGDSHFQYDPFHYLLATIELPSVSQVIEASPEKPYLSLRLNLDPALVGAVMVETDRGQIPSSGRSSAVDVSPIDLNLLDASIRLLRLIDLPAEAPVLMPLITREIIYRLLMGDQGNRLRHLAGLTGYTPDIAKAVERMRSGFDQPLRIEDLARELGMSVSGFHHHFKAVTAMSPLQFQKRLRLQEARRLMLSEDCDAASAAFRVGYNDASHFNREYKSLFGVPPIRDV